MTLASRRLDWVDIAKGLCIILVVLMHATHGVDKALGTTSLIEPFIEWARPFRLPDFFLISGLFLAARIDRPWRAFLDGKVVHFAYFYVLWTHILLAMKAPGLINEAGIRGFFELYVSTLVRPFGPIWFLYLLAVYCIATKLLRRAPVPFVLISAALLHVKAPQTGAFLIDEFANRFVFFYAGYALSRYILTYADRLRAVSMPLVMALILVWAALNSIAVTSGLASMPGLDLAVSAVGIGAIIAFSVMLAQIDLGATLAYLGRNTIAIYVAFTIFMSAVRVALLKLGPGLPGEIVALAATLAGIAGPLLAAYLVKGTPLGFLFERPAWAHLSHRPAKIGTMLDGLVRVLRSLRPAPVATRTVRASRLAPASRVTARVPVRRSPMPRPSRPPPASFDIRTYRAEIR